MCPESLQVISGKPPVLQELEANTPAPRSQQLRVGQYLGLTREKQLLTGRRSFVFRWVLLSTSLCCSGLTSLDIIPQKISECWDVTGVAKGLPMTHGTNTSNSKLTSLGVKQGRWAYCNGPATPNEPLLAESYNHLQWPFCPTHVYV